MPINCILDTLDATKQYVNFSVAHAHAQQKAQRVGRSYCIVPSESAGAVKNESGKKRRLVHRPVCRPLHTQHRHDCADLLSPSYSPFEPCSNSVCVPVL